MPGAELLGLQTPDEIGIRERGAHAVAAVPVDDVYRRGVERTGRVDHMREQGPSRKRLKHFRQIRVHALALASGQENDR